MKENDQILTDYDLQHLQLKSFESKMKGLVSDLLETKDIQVHNISGRVKDRVSLDKKLTRKGKYKSINEITDLVGIRIITFFENEVDTVANLIKDEFEIDISNSIDKRIIEFDRFGYSSLHFVASLNSSRKKLLEYKNFKSFKFEIQIRSILQHAWAEIEHDLGYKAKANIPDIVKRNFSRVSALLEIADLEFNQLKLKLQEYEKDVQVEIINDPVNVDINDISLITFIENDGLSKNLDENIIKSTKSSLVFDNELIDASKHVNILRFLGIQNINQLATQLKEKKTTIESFAINFLKIYDKESPDPDGAFFTPGVGIFYLCYLMVAERNDPDYLEKFLKEFHPPFDTGLSKKILSAYAQINV